jgi:DNA processing protein
LAKGCHALIRQGGKLVETAEDVLEELRFQFVPKVVAGMAAERVTPDFELDVESRALLETLGYEPMSVDALIERCGLTAETVSSMLLVLELHSYVESLPGGRYSRVDKRA